MKNKLFLILISIPFLAISQKSISSSGTPTNKSVNNLILNTRTITSETTLINDVKIENSSHNRYLNTALRQSKSLKNSESIKRIRNYELDKILIEIRPIKDFKQTLQDVQELNLNLKIDN